ncbi:MAG: hypothetical protein EPO32_14590 [Anaerolineae bacterium]|nr:MAG: hypothetical protein EPO32_14590 [Anaerolineae bacterium]
MRAYADNVVIVLEPLPKMAGGLHVPENKPANWRGVRVGRVIASGPGHYRSRRVTVSLQACTLQNYTEETPAFIANETRANDRVLVDAKAGQDYSLDLSVPRHNKDSVYAAYGGERGQFRIVRESEIICVVSDDAKVE